MAESLKLEFGGDGFATVRMVNGENRFRLETINEWNTILDQVLENKEVKGLLITGEGRFFSNGIDLQWLGMQKGDITRDYITKWHALMVRVLCFPVPTAALVNGHAFGGGAFLALSCDYRVMKPDKGWLNWPETALGLRFGDPLLKLAKTKIPAGIVQREALLFAKRLTGVDAKRLGLVDDVTEESKMADSAKQLINEALGRNGLDRNIVHAMKQDIYAQDLEKSKL